eukprot:2566467-Rhodomonas_salina.3
MLLPGGVVGRRAGRYGGGRVRHACYGMPGTDAASAYARATGTPTPSSRSSTDACVCPTNQATQPKKFVRSERRVESAA